MSSNQPAVSSLARAMGKIPSGLFILTSQQGEEAIVLLASWVQQISFEPLGVSVALGRERAANAFIEQSGKLALSIIDATDLKLMKKYARGVKKGENPFEGVKIIPAPSGLPVMAQALAWLDCKVLNICDFGGDHLVFACQVTAGELLREGMPFTHVRGTGMHY